MNMSQFMVFSIDDGQIQCVELFYQKSLMLISTQKSIILYDLCTSTALAACPHQTNKSKQQQYSNSNESSLNNQVNSTQIAEQHETAIEMHYFPITKSVKQPPISINNNTSNTTTIGHLLVHYKMKGISVYDINKIIPTTNKLAQQLINNDKDVQSNIMFEIAFNNFTLEVFGSAFLKLAFHNVFYERIQAQSSSQLKQQLSKSTLLQSQQSISINQLQTTLSNIQHFIRDYKLRLINKLNKSRQFFIFTNQNQLYEVKRMKLNDQDGRVIIMERYQLDEESAEFSLGTVTAMVVVEYGKNEGQQGDKQRISQSRHLIIAMQGRNVFSYQLPIIDSSLSNPNTQHYLQPTKTLHLQQQLKSLNPNITSSINNQLLDYSIISIEMIHDSLGLIVVRKLGVWVVDFRKMKVVGKVQGGVRGKSNVNVSKGFDDNDDKRVNEAGNVKDKKMYQFNDARIIKLITSSVSTKTTFLNKQTLISSTLILSTKNKLFKLTFSITINKQFDTNKIYHQSIKISKAKFTTIEQINTNLIEDIKMVEQAVSNQQEQNIQGAKNKVVQIYGHYKQDKVFHLFL